LDYAPNVLTIVLDIGTGTGIWAIDFADEHPEAEVIGTDLSPIQRKILSSSSDHQSLTT
jgi:methylase of polypeptide subunit release factors